MFLILCVLVYVWGKVGVNVAFGGLCSCLFFWLVRVVDLGIMSGPLVPI